jgi:hypothetical protein
MSPLVERMGSNPRLDCQLNRRRLRFARPRAYIPGIDDVTYWTEKLRQAEQELDAARTRTALDEAASKVSAREGRTEGALRAVGKDAESERAGEGRPHTPGPLRFGGKVRRLLTARLDYLFLVVNKSDP